MKPSEARESDDLGMRGWSFLHRSPCGRVAESSVYSLAVVILDVLEEEPSKVLLVDGDDVVEQLATNGPNPPFRQAVLPG
jgi:hypothetical protein